MAVEDVQHAVRNAMAIDELEEDLCLYLGPARDGSLLEVITLAKEDSDVVIQVMAMRPKYPRLVTMADKNYGRTRRRKPITDELIEELARKAEEGFDVDEIIRRRGGRPPMGAGAATVESVRLEPELRDALRKRAESEGRTNSELIREALRRYLQAS